MMRLVIAWSVAFDQSVLQSAPVYIGSSVEVMKSSMLGAAPLGTIVATFAVSVGGKPK